MTVVVPAFNAEATIEGVLASVAGQTKVPREVVVVDDGSTDRTADLAEATGATVVRRGRSGGPSAARNDGWTAARGSWIAFLDADDRWHPEKLERQLSACAMEPSAIAIAADWVRETGEPWVPSPLRPPGTWIEYHDLLVMNRFQTSTVLVRKRAMEEVGGFRPDLDGVEDWDCWLRLAHLGPVLKLDWPYVRYADTPGGVSKDLRRIYDRMWGMLDREVKAGSTCLDEKEVRSLLAWHHLRFATNWLLTGDRAEALAVVRRLREDHLVGAAPKAVVEHLAPFLWKRARRRIPKLRRT